uniref:Putative secreted protein n=1 Tax=Amblyomma americanum TaxID=6943 RepID=A0A0C9SET8_AMBAM
MFRAHAFVVFGTTLCDISGPYIMWSCLQTFFRAIVWAQVSRLKPRGFSITSYRLCHITGTNVVFFTTEEIPCAFEHNEYRVAISQAKNYWLTVHTKHQHKQKSITHLETAWHLD